jgi:hypothetical protein
VLVHHGVQPRHGAGQQRAQLGEGHVDVPLQVLRDAQLRAVLLQRRQPLPVVVVAAGADELELRAAHGLARLRGVRALQRQRKRLQLQPARRGACEPGL